MKIGVVGLHKEILADGNVYGKETIWWNRNLMLDLCSLKEYSVTQCPSANAHTAYTVELLIIQNYSYILFYELLSTLQSVVSFYCFILKCLFYFSVLQIYYQNKFQFSHYVLNF